MSTPAAPSPLRVTFAVKLKPTRTPRRRTNRSLPRLRYALLLGHQIERGLQTGEFRTQKDAAAVIHRTWTRVGQLTALTRLAPSIQADLLDLPREVLNRIPERLVRPIVAELAWENQRNLWADVLARIATDCDSVPE